MKIQVAYWSENCRREEDPKTPSPEVLRRFELSCEEVARVRNRLPARRGHQGASDSGTPKTGCWSTADRACMASDTGSSTFFPICFLSTVCLFSTTALKIVFASDFLLMIDLRICRRNGLLLGQSCLFHRLLSNFPARGRSIGTSVASDPRVRARQLTCLDSSFFTPAWRLAAFRTLLLLIHISRASWRPSLKARDGQPRGIVFSILTDKWLDHGVGCSIVQIDNADWAYVDTSHDGNCGERRVDSSKLKIMRTNTEDEEFCLQLVPATGKPDALADFVWV